MIYILKLVPLEHTRGNCIAIGNKNYDRDFCKKLLGCESKVRIAFKYSLPYL